MNYIIQFNIIHPICQMSGVFSAETRPPAYHRMAAGSEDVQDIPEDIPVLGLILLNYIIQFNIIHPICQTSGVFSAETRPPPYYRAAAVSDDAQDIPQGITVLGLSLLNIQ
jgi:hypothetical protein